MNENKLDLLDINDLIKESPFAFYIPSYQRGYRWTEIQVTDLLDDIYEFINRKDRKIDEFYCLQPVVVKPKDESWEVIDGQQRLTTIFLLLKYFNNRLAEDFRKALYTIHYETREGSAEYLDSLKPEKSKTNVDYYHIYQAFTTIKNWFSQKQNIANDFEGALLNSTKIIWYEVNEDVDSIDIFTRLNIGKIPLTNAELIKALFLFRDNFKGSDQTRQLRQIEIAGEWDRIEAALRNKEFWGFLSDGNDSYDNRVEFIFDLMSGKTKEDKDFTFRYFHKRFNEIKDVEVAWKEVKDYFLAFQEWYNDRKIFHLVGFLITVGEKVSTLKSESVGKTKTVFKDFLKNKIKNYTNFQVYELSYSENSDKVHIKNILLLFNIVSIINNAASNYRFQFGRFKVENWDIEHIHSVKSRMPEREEHRRDWMNEVMLFTKSEELKARIKRWIETEKKNRIEEFETIYDDVLKAYSEEEITEEINDIRNLTLLDAGTNRGYKNAIYPIKRNKIIQKDQNGTFIPLCTKNVFLKYYNDSVEQMTLWGKADRKSYLQAILTVLESYLPDQTLNYN
ncbi:DUF262 domain-containing protein [Ferruginibacter sp.]|nr:DUF262 domain-containing protein [Ferruginibacter sp.]